MDVNTLLDAFILDTEIASMEVVSQSDTEAIVQVDGSMTMDIDAEAMVPFIQALLEMSGMEATPETIEMFSGMMMSEFEAESTEISEEITLVPGEDGGWLICDQLGALDDGTGSERRPTSPWLLTWPTSPWPPRWPRSPWRPRASSTEAVGPDDTRPLGPDRSISNARPRHGGGRCQRVRASSAGSPRHGPRHRSGALVGAPALSWAP